MESCNFSTLVVLIGVLVLCTEMKAFSASGATNTYNTTKYTQFIQTSCNETTYPQLCVKSLSSYSNKIKANPQKLAYTALSLSLKSAKNTSSVVSKLSQQSNLKRNERAAIKDCVENISESIDELRQSVKEIKTLNATQLDYKMSNIMTWVSAALTDDDTCLEGLDEETVKGKIKDTVSKNVLNIAQMTSNALALVNSLNFTQLYSR
ncbi:hypothetical protein IFM89_034320 [Coptis chinensis]|uniref:Pectinesterase inhibitor domain-containing protein n=1 Tax=Coptis chinensis TaxID=261450 RepID=A0A835M810_9MAGN|nr:hypothetical protein IFM89_034320 [Coptis chinensis]